MSASWTLHSNGEERSSLVICQFVCVVNRIEKCIKAHTKETDGVGRLQGDARGVGAREEPGPWQELKAGQRGPDGRGCG